MSAITGLIPILLNKTFSYDATRVTLRLQPGERLLRLVGSDPLFPVIDPWPDRVAEEEGEDDAGRDQG